MIYKNVQMGNGCVVQEGVFLGIPPKAFMDKREEEWPKTVIGENAVIRTGTIIYGDVEIGKNFQSGHNVMIREQNSLGDNVLIGTNTVVEANIKIGSNVSIQSSVFIPNNTIIEDKVFIGPNAVLTNDKYPIRIKDDLPGPKIRRGASLGANCTIMPGIEIGEGAMVGGGAVVTRDVPANKLAIGNPAKIVDLPEKLRQLNLIGD